jgi:phosphoglycerol transferase MdoB-like AlkP superfamily enzyme
MKIKIKELVDKMKKNFSKFRVFCSTYARTNILFVSYIVVALFNSTVLRYYTTESFWNIKPVLADLAVVILIGSVGYFFKPKNQFKYFSTCLIVLTAICFINSVYYNNYYSFVSLSLLATSTQAMGVANALTKILELKDFIFFVPIIIFFIINGVLKRKGYFDFVSQIEVGRIRAMNTAIAGLVVLGFFVSMLTGTDLSRLKKQWNREYVVMQFGIYIYQGNDVIASLKPQISPLFGVDTATKEFVDYYQNNTTPDTTNKYTNIYEGKNVLVIHAESIQKWLLNTTINGVEITPTLNKLSKQGMYFSNFYSQESVGTSSDTEFTFNTSLLPASSGTVFVSYWDRNYAYTTQKLLEQKGYYTFSMHGNNCSMWNRSTMYKSLGYDDFYCYTDAYKIDDVIGIGLSDKSFFKQSAKIITDIDKEHDKFYGTLIMLTNHTPWADISSHSTFDVTMHYTDPTTGEKKTAPYLEGTTMGDYIKSANYADAALGEFINQLDADGILDDTVIVIYGDHDAKLKKSEYVTYYNYDPVTQSLKDKEAEDYVDVDYYSYELNRSVPFIIWTKDQGYNLEVNQVMGMYDAQPTLGNMLNFYNPYALGHDIFSTTENVVIYPNGNWLTNKMYYNSQKDEGLALTLSEPVSSDYITKYNQIAAQEVSVSDKIIVYDLFEKTKDLTLDIKTK